MELLLTSTIIILHSKIPPIKWRVASFNGSNLKKHLKTHHMNKNDEFRGKEGKKVRTGPTDCRVERILTSNQTNMNSEGAPMCFSVSVWIFRQPPVVGLMVAGWMNFNIPNLFLCPLWMWPGSDWPVEDTVRKDRLRGHCQGERHVWWQGEEEGEEEESSGGAIQPNKETSGGEWRSNQITWGFTTTRLLNDINSTLDVLIHYNSQVSPLSSW